MSAVVLPIHDWPDDPLPLQAEIEPAAPFPMDALPPVLADVGRLILRTSQAPDALIGASLLAATSLAAQSHADVILPHGAGSPLSLYVASVAESGERKSAVDNLVLAPHRAFEKGKVEIALARIAEWETTPRKDRGESPRTPVYITGDLTIEGLAKALHSGLPAVGIFTAEGGSLLGGHAMSEEAALRTAAGFSKLWDGSPIDRVRGLDGCIKLYGRRTALHLMVQPKAAFAWLSNPVLRDQGLFSRCLVTYPQSTAGTRLFRDEDATEADDYARYLEEMRRLLDRPWQVDEHGGLQTRPLGIGGEARKLWIDAYNEIERAIPTTLAPIRPFASKGAEQIGRIAGCFEMLADPECISISHDAMQRAAAVFEYFTGEALRLATARPLHQDAEQAATMYRWLQVRAKREVSLAELCQKGPPSLRAARDARVVMGTLCEHYLARLTTDVLYADRVRSEGWEVRL